MTYAGPVGPAYHRRKRGRRLSSPFDDMRGNQARFRGHVLHPASHGADEDIGVRGASVDLVDSRGLLASRTLRYGTERLMAAAQACCARYAWYTNRAWPPGDPWTDREFYLFDSAGALTPAGQAFEAWAQ